MRTRPTRPHGLLRTLIAVASGFALVAGPLASAPAQAAVASISGTVTGPSGQMLPGIYAVVIAPDGNTESVQTDSLGRYSIDVPEGTYTLAFQDLGNTYASQFWENKLTYEEADSFVVGASGLTGMDVRLGLNSTITGTVTARATHAPIDNVLIVAAVSDDGGGWYYVNASRTEADGTYSIFVPNGHSYRLGFSHDAYATQYFDDKNGDQQPDLVTVSSAHVGSVDAQLDPRPAVGGTVTSGGAALGSVEVTAYALTGGTWQPAYSGTTGTDGTYVFDVEPGTYRLGFHKTGYDDTFLTDRFSVDQADSFTVGRTAVTGRNATMYRTPTPSVSGTAQVGRTLTADPGVWNPAGVALSYQWFRGDRTIAGATARTYVVSADDQGTSLRVAVTGTASGYPTRTVTSPATAAVIVGTLTTDTPTVSGTAEIGSTLTLSRGAWGPEGVNLGVQWFRGSSAIADAHDDTYTVTSADAGQQLWARVTGSMSGYTTASRDSARTSAVPAPPNPIVSTGAPTISGLAKVGQTLTAAPGAWNPSDVTVTYQWRRAGQDVAGATGSTYVVTSDDVASTLSVRVTATRTGMTTATADSPQTATVVPADAPSVVAGTPSVSGVAKVGQTLTAMPGTWSPSDAVLTYQWRRAGVNVAGATSATYTLTDDDQGSTLTVRVTGTKAGFTAASAVSAPTASIAADLPAIVSTIAPTITGAAKVGQTLTATSGTWDPSDAVATYQWRRNGVDVPGATTRTYRVTAADVGRALSVRVTATKTGHAPATALSAATAAVAKATPTVAASVAMRKQVPTFTVVLSASGVTPTGKVTVKLGSKVLKSAWLSSRKAVLVLPKQAKGTRTYTIVYGGDGSVAARSVARSVKVY